MHFLISLNLFFNRCIAFFYFLCPYKVWPTLVNQYLRQYLNLVSHCSRKNLCKSSYKISIRSVKVKRIVTCLNRFTSHAKITFYIFNLIKIYWKFVQSCQPKLILIFFNSLTFVTKIDLNFLILKKLSLNVLHWWLELKNYIMKIIYRFNFSIWIKININFEKHLYVFTNGKNKRI